MSSVLDAEREIADNYFKRIYTHPKTADLLLEIIANPSQAFQKEFESLACSALKCFINYQRNINPININLFAYLINKIHFLMVSQSQMNEELGEIYCNLILFTNSNDPFQLENEALQMIENSKSPDDLTILLNQILSNILDIYINVYSLKNSDEMKYISQFYERIWSSTTPFFTPEKAKDPTMFKFIESLIQILTTMIKSLWFLNFIQNPQPLQVVLSIISWIFEFNINNEMCLLLQRSALFLENLVSRLILNDNSSFNKQFNHSIVQQGNEMIQQFSQQFMPNIVNVSFNAACAMRTKCPDDIITQSSLISIVLQGIYYFQFTSESFQNMFNLALSYAEFRQVNFLYYNDNPSIFYDLAFCNSTSTNCELRGAAVELIDKLSDLNLKELLILLTEKSQQQLNEALMRMVTVIAPKCSTNEGSIFIVEFIQKAMQQNFSSQLEFSSYLFLIVACYNYLNDEQVLFFFQMALNLLKELDTIKFTLAVEILVRSLKRQPIQAFPFDEIGHFLLERIDMCLNFAVFIFLRKVIKRTLNKPKEFIFTVITTVIGVLQSDEDDMGKDEDVDEINAYLLPISSCFKKYIQVYPQFVPYDLILQFIHHQIELDVRNFVSIESLIYTIIHTFIGQKDNPISSQILDFVLSLMSNSEPFTMTLIPSFRNILVNLIENDRDNLIGLNMTDKVFQIAFFFLQTINDSFLSICIADILSRLIRFRCLNEEQTSQIIQLSIQLLKNLNSSKSEDNLNLTKENLITTEALFNIIAELYYTFPQKPEPELFNFWIQYVQCGAICRLCDANVHIKAFMALSENFPDLNIRKFVKEVQVQLPKKMEEFRNTINKNILQLLMNTDCNMNNHQMNSM